jgi:hypothetical protein
MHRIKLLVRIYIVVIVVVAKDKGEYDAQMILYYAIQVIEKNFIYVTTKGRVTYWLEDRNSIIPNRRTGDQRKCNSNLQKCRTRGI